MENFLEAGDFDGLASYCEEAELSAPLGIPSPEIYGSLLAVYLLRNELDHAKLLWKRIPPAVKTSNPEIGKVWDVGKRIWRREFAEVYQLVEKPSWPPHIAPILSGLPAQMRKRVVELVSRAYSDIKLSELSLLVGLSEDSTRPVVLELGWEISSSQLVYPKATATNESELRDSSDDRLSKLVDIVSFLEN